MMRSFTTRSLLSEGPKNLGPKGFKAGGLVMASENGLTFLQNHTEPSNLTGLEAVVIVEGLTDTLKAAQFFEQRLRDIAVLGYFSGSTLLLKSIIWPSGIEVWIGTDPDPVGDKYAAEVRAALPDMRLSRIRIGGKS